MTPKEYLSQCLTVEQEIRSLQSEYEDIKSTILTSANYQSEPVTTTQKNSTEDKTINIIEKMTSYWDDINRKIDEKVDLKTKISAEIDRVKNPNHRSVLRMRYISLMKWEKIASVMNYDIRSIYRLHGTALQDFESSNPDLFK